MLIVGLNPFRLFDDAYRGFLELVAGQIAAAIANAEAYEEERRRAEALAEIDRAKTAFFSNVSHEFRTPLTLMLGPLEEVLAKPDSELPSAQSRAGRPWRTATALRLLKLVNTLLDFSRIEAGRDRRRASSRPTSVAFTAELASTFRSAIERAGLDLRDRLSAACRRPSTSTATCGRRSSSTCCPTPSSSPSRARSSSRIRPTADGTAVELAVRDTGTGIPADELPHLFERFHRVEGARGRSIEGSGIGLALVQELVKLHGGTISVASEVGVGSTFTIRLPFGMAHLPAGRVRAGRESAPAGMRAEAYVQEALSWLGDQSRTTDAPTASESAGPGPVAAAGRRSARAAGRRQSRHAPLRRAVAARRRLPGRNGRRRRGRAGRDSGLETSISSCPT